MARGLALHLLCLLGAVTVGNCAKQAAIEVEKLPGLAGALLPGAKIPRFHADHAAPSLLDDPAEWFQRRTAEVTGSNDLSSALMSVRGLFDALLAANDEVEDEASNSKHALPIRARNAEREAMQREQAKIAANARYLASLSASPPSNLTCSGVGILYDESGATVYSCNGTELPLFAYDAVKILQDSAGTGGGSGSGVKQLLVDVADALQSTGTSFNSIISPNTGVFVNVSQLFSGAVLDSIERSLNITGPNETLVDVGRLFQTDSNGNPVVNLTDLIEALPTNTLQQVIDNIQCEAAPSQTAQCLCPVDYTGTNCTQVRPITCAITVDIPSYQACVKSNGRVRPPNSPPLPSTRYIPSVLGDPPCLYVSRKLQSNTLSVPLNVTCYFADNRGNYPYCNGTLMTPAFVAAQAAARGVTVDTLPGSPPYYDFDCLERLFSYTTGGPSLTGDGISQSSNTQSLTVTLRPWNFVKLSDATFAASAVIPPSVLNAAPAFWQVTFPLAVGAMSKAFFPGGRLYSEAFVEATVTHGNNSYSQAPATRLSIDDEDFVEGTTWTLDVGLLVGLLVMFAVIIAAGVYWYLRRKRKQAEAEELAELRRRVEREGLGYAAVSGSPATTGSNHPSPPDSHPNTSRRRLINKKKHGWF